MHNQVCLPARGTSQATGKKCTVTGYGYMGESKFYIIKTNDHCDNVYMEKKLR